LPSTSKSVEFVFTQVLPVGAISIGFSTIIDRLFYGRWVIVPLKFLQVNVLYGIGNFYGTHPWHWYFTQGFTTIGFTLLPLGCLGIWWCERKKRALSYLMIWINLVYSFLSHKEFRFVHPALPLLHVYCGFAISYMMRHYPARKYQVLVLSLLLLNVPMAAYFSFWHQRAPIDVMWHINTKLAESVQQNKSVDFLMNCHSTPFYAYVHNSQISMRFLDCTPSWKDPSHITESQEFTENPRKFVEDYYKIHELPTYVVVFDDVVPKLGDLLRTWSYNECAKFSHIPFENSYIILFCKNKQ